LKFLSVMEKKKGGFSRPALTMRLGVKSAAWRESQANGVRAGD
jgi:hypothetical protein